MTSFILVFFFFFDKRKGSGVPFVRRRMDSLNHHYVLLTTCLVLQYTYSFNRDDQMQLSISYC